jgi:hypothetical protein
MRWVRLLSTLGLLCIIVPTMSASSIAAASRTPPCASDQLMVLASDTEGLAGTGAMVIDIANIGVSCRIGGYPKIEFFNAKGVAIDREDSHNSSMAFAEPRSITVTLGREDAASIGISWSDNSVTLPNGHSTTCPRTFSVSVALSNGVGRLSGWLPVKASPCGGGLEVTPIEAGAWPRSNT